MLLTTAPNVDIYPLKGKLDASVILMPYVTDMPDVLICRQLD
jgi:hypothetical protein